MSRVTASSTTGGIFWPVVAMLQFAALIIVGVLAWSQPWDGWEALAALGGWAAAAGATGAVLWAMRMARRDAEWRNEDRARAVLDDKLYLLFRLDDYRKIESAFRLSKELGSRMAATDRSVTRSSGEALLTLIVLLDRIDVHKTFNVSPEAGVSLALARDYLARLCRFSESMHLLGDEYFDKLKSMWLDDLEAALQRVLRAKEATEFAVEKVRNVAR